MRIPLDWLDEIVEVPVAIEPLAARLTEAGFEVEGIHRHAVPARVVVGRILEAAPIEGAALRACRVDVGSGEPVEVVCGAPDAAVGVLAPLALPGAVLPAGAVEAREVRGLRSAGVLCSERDLGLGEDHAGLLHLERGGLVAGTAAAAPEPGTEIAGLLPEIVVLELAISPNRGDCASVLGIAREVSALWGAKLRSRRRHEPPIEATDEPFAVAIEAPDLCSWYCGQRFLAPTAASSPLWMRRRLSAAGVRPIGPAVDVTNYVMLELGQPLHAFDLDRLHGGRLLARRAAAGERLRLLDGREVPLEGDDLVIADAAGPVALAGIMGGAGSEVVAGTARLALESAVFRPASVRRTARRLGIHTEASFRFERGIDGTGSSAAAARAGALLAALGARPLGRMIEAGGASAGGEPIPFAPRRANALLGTAVEPGEMMRRLRAIGCTVGRMDAAAMGVQPPAHRHDLRQPADLAEEVARIGGLGAIPTTRPRVAVRGRGGHAGGIRAMRDALAARGLCEAVLLAFADPADNARFPGLWEQGVAAVGLRNPLASVAREMRTSLLPGLFAALRVNQSHGESFVPLFSAATVFARGADGERRERTDVAILLWGAPPAAIGREARGIEIVDLKRVIEDAMADAGLPALRWDPCADAAFLHPGRAAEIRCGGRRLGRAGALHPALVGELGLRPGDVWLAEIDAEAALATRRGRTRYVEPPRFPSIERDAALVVDEGVRAGAIAETMLAQHHPLVENVVLFDEYRGAGVPAGRKSLAYTVSYRAKDRTLTDPEVNAAHEEILNRLSSVLRFERRGV